MEKGDGILVDLIILVDELCTLSYVCHSEHLMVSYFLVIGSLTVAMFSFFSL